MKSRAHPFYAGNNITLLHTGKEYFPTLEQAIHNAQREIFIEVYLYAADATGKRIASALVEAVKRGVVVHLLVDAFGSWELPLSFREKLEQAGIELLFFSPGLFPWVLRVSQLRRLHRKLVVIDRACAFVGGINIVDDIDLPDLTTPRYDFAVRIEGPLVVPIYKAAHGLWNRVAWTHFKYYPRRKVNRKTNRSVEIPSSLFPKTRHPAIKTQRAAFITRDNIRHRHEIERTYLQAIQSAQKEIIIANAYFFPGVRFRHALVDAARRGVSVILLLQGRAEYWVLHYASRGLYGSLLDAGVQIYDYHRGFLHAKVAVIDRHWATVGSSNIDPFSLLLAREANVVIEDDAFAQQLRQNLIDTIHTDATAIPPQQWYKQPWYQRLMIWGSYTLFRVLVGIIGVREKY